MARFSIRPIFAWLLLSILVIVETVAEKPKGDAPGRPGASRSDSAEAKLIVEMRAEDPRRVLNALDDLAAFPNPSTNVIGVARQLLTDPQPSVRKKAARVLGVMHVAYSADDLKAICRMLKSHDRGEVGVGLRVLRDLKAREAVLEVTPLLKSNHIGVLRDACRTLAVLGSKEQIPLIQPLLNHTDEAVQQDAKLAIAALEANK